jgi:glutamyl-Q tRNA(Asp) synthetase
MQSPTALPGKPTYIGRFAPSPTGPLHFGSLVSALASYLHARSQQGQWLVRMEDLDPPREQPGAADQILTSLEKHGLSWDGAVLYQSQRHTAYGEALETLRKADLIYPCHCTRQDLQALGGVYDGRCRNQQVTTHKPHALRLKLYDLPAPWQALPEIVSFTDLFQGQQHQDLRREAGDIIVKRRDGLFAYQLAVVVDDIAQGITHVVRGSDLLEVTGRQWLLFRLLGARPPQFGHIPLALHPNGQKLSKQNHAPPLNSAEAGTNLWRALGFLGQNPPADLYNAPPAEVLSWASAHWQTAQIAGFGAVPPDIDPQRPAKQ